METSITRAIAWAPLRSGQRRYALTLLLLPALVLGHLSLGAELSPAQLWSLLSVSSSNSFAAMEFELTVLPRMVMAVLVGAATGLSGSVLQQLTQNRLVSPMTLGASSGAWLGLICATLWFPLFAVRHGEWAALGGALASVGLVLMVAGRDGIAGLPVILAGMALNLLLGALAMAILLLNNQQTRGLFVWGAGDLGQIDWQWVAWLWPKLLVGLLLVALAPRALTLMQLGSAGAQARGMTLWPVIVALFLVSIWLTSVSITAVGLIGFIGLITPNMARLFGARTSRDELVYSALLGVMLLLVTDGLALLINRWVPQLIPSGATVALIGAPVLIWLSRRQLSAEDQRALALPSGAQRMTRRSWWLVLLAAAGVLMISLCLNRGADGWTLGWPSPLIWSLRWPRVLTAATAGCGLAVAGMLLQRLLRNPLASPDILGLTAGASLAVMLALMLFGSSLFWIVAPFAALVGSLVVLGGLLVLGRRHQYSPAIMVLVGISLAALSNTLVQLGLANGSGDALALLGWLSGSTYRVTAIQATWLSGGVVVLIGLSLLFQRALTLMSIGDSVAMSRGLDVPVMRVTLLLLVSLLCALVTSLLGPVAFLGLLAPHMAAMLGARCVRVQLLLSALLGAVLMLLSDWIGRTLIFPLQIPVGLVASVVCGSYFVYLLVRQRLA
ncbi:hypothetical protein LCGC14_0211970 [marine sediment metagenome]|uniref:Fe(3+)-hydroxamate ABC transporter permease FhuB n=1 Tax=marine sediment metagenome TaxID=412755 RepID=A0A0F9UKF0_9ZZZZ